MPTKRIFRFGQFRLDEGGRRLECGGNSLPLPPKAFDTLIELVGNAGSLVEKQRLLDSVWAGVHVEDAVVARAISDIRKALQAGSAEEWIETVPKFGYRFRGAVHMEEPGGVRRVRVAWLVTAALTCVLALTGVIRRSPGPVTPGQAAYDAYMRGVTELDKREPAAIRSATIHFRQAIDLEPRYARAYAGLADAYMLLGGYGVQPQMETLPKAKATALRAIQLDPTLAEAYASLGLITENLDWDWQAAESYYRKAIRLKPAYATAHHWYAEMLSILARFDDSRAEFQKARSLDPLSSIIRADEAQLYFFKRDYLEAIELLRQTAQDDPAFVPAYERLAWTYLAAGEEKLAWEASRQIPGCGPGTPCESQWTAWIPSLDPLRTPEARKRLDSDASIQPFVRLIAEVRNGQTGRALDVLDSMVERHSIWLITARVNPLFDPLRAEPRFQEVLRKLHLDGQLRAC